MKGAAIAVAILAALVALGALIVAVWFLAATYLCALHTASWPPRSVWTTTSAGRPQPKAEQLVMGAAAARGSSRAATDPGQRRHALGLWL